MKTPLYLGPSAQVRLDDGCSLYVSSKGCIPQRFPIGRISRIVARAGCQLPMDACIALLRQGVPLVFCERGSQAKPLGLCVPLRCQPCSLSERIDALLQYPDWRDRYGDWLRAQHNLAMRAVLRRCRIDMRGKLRPRDVQQRLLHHSGVPIGWCGRLLEFWWAAILAWSIAQWRDNGVEGRALLQPGEDWNLPRDISRLLLWSMIPVLVEESRYWRETMQWPGNRVDVACAKRFERHLPVVEKLFRDVNRRLASWLREQGAWR